MIIPKHRHMTADEVQDEIARWLESRPRSSRYFGGSTQSLPREIEPRIPRIWTSKQQHRHMRAERRRTRQNGG